MKKMLKTNPFYILNIPMSSDRTRIADAAEQRSLVYDPDICGRAMDRLLNPARRLAAELDWFPGEDEETVKSIKEAVTAGRAVPADVEGTLNGIGAVNALIFRLEASLKAGSKGGQAAAADAIKTIENRFGTLDRDVLLDVVNNARREAGITQATAGQLETELRHKLERTTEELIDCIGQMTETARLTLMDSLAAQYTGAAKPDTSADNGGSELFCLLADRFDIDTIQERAALEEELDAVIYSVTEHGRMFNITGLMKKYYRTLDKWSRYERPLQTAAALRGASHEESLDVVRKSLDMIMNVVKKDDPVSGYEFLCTLGDTFAAVPGAAELIDPVRSQVGELIFKLTKKTPEEAVRNKRKEKARTKAGIIILLCMFAVIGLLVLLTPSEEEQAYDPSTGYYHEIRLPYSQNYQGEFEELSMPPTGFVFQDTMDEAGRTVTLHIKGNADRSTVLRISNQDYGDGTYIYLPGEKMPDSDKLPGEISEDAAREAGAPADAEEQVADVETGAPADARILTIMIRDGEETDITLPPGEYYISSDDGYSWYGWRLRFNRQFNTGLNGTYEYAYPEMKPEFDKPLALEEGKEYTLDIFGDKPIIKGL